MTDDVPPFDVAISFLHGDEALAQEIADKLLPLKTFVYMQRQEDVAGTDGAVKFREIFLEQTNVSVVLHRARWGTTPFTRVEEAAIEERAMRDGWDHAFFVCLEDAALPKWWPYARISLDYEAFGLDNLIGAVKSQLAKLGIAMRAPTAVEVAAATARREAFDKETAQLLEQSNQAFREAAAELFRHVAEQSAEIQKATAWDMNYGYDHEYFVINTRAVCMQLLLQQVYANTARNADIAVRLFDGYIVTPEDRRAGRQYTQPASEVSSRNLKIKRLPAVGWCWEWKDRTLPPAPAAEVLLREFIEVGTQAAQRAAARMRGG